MKTFKEFSEAYLAETVSDHAQKLMATGKYDPKVRGSAKKFAKDLIDAGATQSQMTAGIAWRKHKHLHPESQHADTKPAAKPEPAKAKPASKPESKPVSKPEPEHKPSSSGAKVKVRDGHVGVGDPVGWKDGVEQYGTVHSIHGDHVKVKAWDDRAGEHYHILKHRSQLWTDN